MSVNAPPETSLPAAFTTVSDNLAPQTAEKSLASLGVLLNVRHVARTVRTTFFGNIRNVVVEKGPLFHQHNLR